MPLDLHQLPQRLALRDGRTLAYQTWGAPAGRPLYFLHGFPGCRIQAGLVAEQAAAANVCLIAPDRPGFGRSSPQPGRRITDFANDVEQLADHLGHSRFGVLGISCGGPYALACAHRIPSRLNYVGLLAGIGPMDVPAIRKGQLPVLRLMFALARINPVLVSPMLGLDWLLFRNNPVRAVRILSAMLTRPDQQLLASNPETSKIFGASLAEAYVQGIGGAMCEASLIGSQRGYALEQINIPVHVYQGGIDRYVPPVMGRYLANQIPKGHFHEYPQEGHLSIVIQAFPDCLKHFITEAMGH